MWVVGMVDIPGSLTYVGVTEGDGEVAVAFCEGCEMKGVLDEDFSGRAAAVQGGSVAVRTLQN